MKSIVNNTVRVLGDYELKYPLECNIDIMGKEFEIHLDNVVGKILFPQISPDFIKAKANGKLEEGKLSIPGPICPINGIVLGNEEDSFGYTKWGATRSFPMGDTEVNRIMIEFYLPENSLETDSQTIYNHIDAWFKRFYDIYEVLSMKPAKRKEVKTPTLVQGYGFRTAGLILCKVNPDTKKFDPIYNNNDNGAHITIEIIKDHLMYE